LKSGIAISSRVRVARNVKGMPFPQKMSDKEAKEVEALVSKAMESCKEYEYHSIENLSNLDRTVLAEKRLISKELLKRPKMSSFFLKRDKSVTVMVNEEDQIRIQSISPGLDLDSAWENCSKVDDMIESSLEYAFDMEFGYLTACPTNTGTGLRASVMVHLPLLVGSGVINAIVQTVGRMGITIRGIYGEGSEATGNLFQISNQTTLGETEEESIQKLKNVVERIIEKEEGARKIFLKNRKMELEDRVFRSIAVARSARIMSTEEAMSKLSDIRVGIDLGILDIDIDTVDKLLVGIQPGNIQKLLGAGISEYERDVKRAELLREKLL
jgi:protein arginine kinase